MASSRSRRRRPHKTSRVPELGTSAPTGRAAMADTRKWLLKTYGPVCAARGPPGPPRTLARDPVPPRRGQTAYDRRDNLVLACKRCNSLKADKSFVAWVLGDRKRAIHLFRYGQHLSDGILDMLRPMVGDEVIPAPPPPPLPRAQDTRRKTRERLAPDAEADESPYEEPSPYLDAAPSARRRPIPDAGGAARPDGAGKPRRRRGRRGGRGRGRRG